MIHTLCFIIIKAGAKDSHHPGDANASMTNSVKETIDVDGIEQADKTTQQVIVVQETGCDKTLTRSDDKGKVVPVVDAISAATGGAIKSSAEQADKDKVKEKVPPVTFLEGIDVQGFVLGKNVSFVCSACCMFFFYISR